MKREKKRFFRNNWIYVVWFILYFSFSVTFLGGGAGGFILALFYYTISISIAFSPLGEEILRFLEKVRPLYTKQEKELLLPIFQDVYDEITEKYPRLKNVEICVIDTVAINALAIGKKTIAVTKGAIETFSEEELKALITHEFAHILNGDTIAILLTTIGNGIFTILVVIAKWAIRLIEHIMKQEDCYDSDFWKITNFIATMFIFIIMFVGNNIVALNSRKNEFIADEFVYKMGYGKDMVEALYLLEKLSLGDDRSAIERIGKNHPLVAKRIGKLEELIDKEDFENSQKVETYTNTVSNTVIDFDF